MEELNRVALDIFDNKKEYKEVDYINIMDNLKKQYLKLKGEKINSEKIVEVVEEEEEEEEEPLYYHNESESEDEEEGYIGTYINHY